MVHVTRRGRGPAVLLVHGGAPPEGTWEAQAVLAERWTVSVVHRRGYPPNPAVERQDWEVDAGDIEALAAAGIHLVGFSYGGTAAAVAACRAPERIRSLTLIEAPIAQPAGVDAEIDEMVRASESFLELGLAAPEEALQRFLPGAGAPWPLPDPVPPGVAEVVRLSVGGRSPWEADPRLEVLAEGRVPVLVVSGGHSPTLERACDRVAERARGERAVLDGAGHFVMRDPRFNPTLERFLSSA